MTWLMVKDTLERVCPSDLRASLPASVKESDWEKIGGSSGIMVVPWEAISLLASSWGVRNTEQVFRARQRVTGTNVGVETGSLAIVGLMPIIKRALEEESVK